MADLFRSGGVCVKVLGEWECGSDGDLFLCLFLSLDFGFC